MNTVAYIATSLDGYIADSDGGVDWLNEITNPDQSDYGFADFLSGLDAILMGSNTFRVVQSFGVWPYTKRVYVLSNSIGAVPSGYENRIQLISGSINAALSKIREEAGDNIYVDGGKIIQSCLARNCLSQLIVTTVPIILGKGIPLFAPSDQRVWLSHVKTEVLGAGLVKSTYSIQQDVRADALARATQL
jgi:dihydrofolate reductase